MATLLTAAELTEAATALPGWTVTADVLHRRFEFPDFSRAFGFMAAAATRAEKLNHHPEWTNVYHRVDVRLRTHDAGGVTALDTALAGYLDDLHRAFG